MEADVEKRGERPLMQRGRRTREDRRNREGQEERRRGQKQQEGKEE